MKYKLIPGGLNNLFWRIIFSVQWQRNWYLTNCISVLLPEETLGLKWSLVKISIITLCIFFFTLISILSCRYFLFLISTEIALKSSVSLVWKSIEPTHEWRFIERIICYKTLVNSVFRILWIIKSKCWVFKAVSVP